jgi:succinate-semialdehyde dehydrogenase/glutarate-semialdehyde dehydrogenase
MNAVPQPAPAPQFPVHNPATGETIGTLPIFGAEQITAAVARAAVAQKRWAATSVRERLNILKRFGQLLCEQKERVAAVISCEAGKPAIEALSTEILVVLDTVKYLRENIGEFLRPQPVPHGNPIMKLKRGTLLRQPYGVVGIISPWNSSLELQRLLREAGLDADLFQVITGDGSAGAALLASSIHKLVFTGSVATGKRVAQAAAARLCGAPS